MHTAYRNRITQAQLIEFIDVCLIGNVIDLIDRKNDLLIRFLQHSGNEDVIIRDSILAVAQHHDGIGFLNGNLNLCLDLYLKRLISDL